MSEEGKSSRQNWTEQLGVKTEGKQCRVPRTPGGTHDGSRA